MDILGIAIPSIVALVSIFISNYLGRKAITADFKLKNLQVRYETFCIPVIKDLCSVPPDSFSLLKVASLVHAGDLYFLPKHIKSNLAYCNPKIISNYHLLLSEITSAKRFYQTGDKKYEQNAINAEMYFSKIVLVILEDSIELSRQLQLPNIAEPLISSFADHNYSYTDL